jgi:hypothetical protein
MKFYKSNGGTKDPWAGQYTSMKADPIDEADRAASSATSQAGAAADTATAKKPDTSVQFKAPPIAGVRKPNPFGLSPEKLAGEPPKGSALPKPTRTGSGKAKITSILTPGAAVPKTGGKPLIRGMDEVIDLNKSITDFLKQAREKFGD